MHFSEIDKIIPNIVESESRNIYSKDKIKWPRLVRTKQLFIAGKKYFESKLLKLQKKRDLHYVSGIYDEIYGISNDEWMKQRTNKRYRLKYSGEKLVVDGLFIFIIRMNLIDRVVKETKAENVIEIGSGRGNNIVALALKNPGTRFSGLEYSNNGVIASNALINNPPVELLKIAGNTDRFTSEKILKKNVKFYQGNAFKLSFEDDSFDLSYTILSLEQMPHRFKDAIMEMKRITRKYCVFIEPFAEANLLHERLHLRRVDYFRYSYKNLIKAGLKPVYFTNNFPQKYKYQAGLLVTEITR